MTLYIESFGTGEEIVLLHGWGVNATIWQNVTMQLRQNYRIHQVYLPGYGKSPLVHPYSLNEIVTQLAPIFSSPVHLIGWSLGGLIAMRWGLEQPTQIKSLTLISSSPCFIQRNDWAAAIPLIQLQEFATQLTSSYPQFLRRFLTLQTGPNYEARRQLRTIESNLLQYPPPLNVALWEGLKILAENDLRKEINQITCPVLLHYGKNDDLIPFKVGRWLQSAFCNAHLVIYPQAAHLPFISDNQDFAHAQQKFFSLII